MRRAIVPLALILALATGSVLTELRLVVLAPLGAGDASAREAANLATVRGFYAAVNHALGTGDDAPLGTFVAAGFVDHVVRPGMTPDLAGLRHTLQSLHATEPTLWLTVVDLVAHDDRVAVLVRVDGARGGPAPGLPAIAGRAWGPMDVFRLRGDRIVEHWGDVAGLGVAESLLAVTVPVERPATKMVEVDRLTYPPGAADWHWTSGPTILAVESAALTIAYDRLSIAAATVVRATGAPDTVAPGGVARLAVGDALILESHRLYQTRNDGVAPAVSLTVWSGNPTFPQGAGPANDGDERQGTPPPGSTSEALAGGHTAVLPVHRATVTIGRVTLAPGAVVDRHQVAYVELAVVEAGRMALTVENGRAWVRAGSTEEMHPVTNAAVAVGEGIAFDAGTTVAYTPAGNEPLVVLMISIGTAVDGVAAVS